MKPCDQCNMADYCADLGRCYFKDINDTRAEEGELTAMDEVEEPELRKSKPAKVPKELSQAHRDLLMDVLNF